MENLYSKIPPTKLRNKEEKFSPANTDSKFWTLIADLFFRGMLQNRFFAFVISRPISIIIYIICWHSQLSEDLTVGTGNEQDAKGMVGR